MKRADFLRVAALLVPGLACRERAGTRDMKSLTATSLPPGVELAPAWDFNGVIGTGQSLSVGASGAPLRATKPSFHNLKLAGDADASRAVAPDEPGPSLVPLCEPIRALTSRYPGAYPRNIFGETPHTAMASQITALFLAKTAGRGDYVSVHSVVGESGQAMRVIAKDAERTENTGHAYAASLAEARTITRLARAAGKSFGVAAVVLTHGESDAENPRYLEQLLELAASYDRDLRAITGQARPVVLFATQQSSCPTEPGAVARSSVAVLEASERAPRSVVCVGPRYQYPYVGDGVHLDALGYDLLGEKYGQVYFERVVCGRDWRPLAPVNVSRAGDVIEVELHVPVPPLRWDEGAAARPAALPAWDKGRGFELTAGGAPLTIEEVVLSGARARVRFSGSPRAPLVLRYAQSATRARGPKKTFRLGALCDSDPFVGALTKLPQRNYAVMFERVVS